MSEVGSADQKKTTGRISRRQFLKFAGAVLAASQLPGEWRETENFQTPVLMIDFAPTRKINGIVQSGYPDNDKIIQQALGPDYISRKQIVTEFGADIFTNKEEFRTDFFRRYPKAAAMYGIMATFQNHGELVGETMRKTWKNKGVKNSVYIEPLQEVIDFGSARLTQDELGNHGFFVQVEPRPIIDLLSKHPDQKIVNFSFTLGEVGFWIVSRIKKRTEQVNYPSVIVGNDENGNKTYTVVSGDGKPLSEEEYEKMMDELSEKTMKVIELTPPSIKEIDAYKGENAEANLSKLFQVCQAFPDKLFVVAAGNYASDLRPARQKMVDGWPNNIIFVAEWNGDDKQPTGLVDGADLYVDNAKLGFGNGSSVSTPIVSAVATQLFEQGLGIEEIKRKLLSKTHIEIFDRSYTVTKEPDQEIKVFDP